jgi:hypothetical protein
MKLSEILSVNNIFEIESDSRRKVTISGNIFSVRDHIKLGPILNIYRIMSLRI